MTERYNCHFKFFIYIIQCSI